MIEGEIEDDMTNFVDIDVNAFRVEVLTLKKTKQKFQIEMEVDTKIDKVICGPCPLMVLIAKMEQV